MTKRANTKRALLMSVLSLLLCVSMLVGTTFAWFTDSVTSAGNIIKAGNLDVEMYWAEGQNAVPADDADWTDASTGAIFNYSLWEPGYTQVRHIKIANEGSLALQYKVQIQANGEVSDLSDVIDVYYIDPAQQIANRSDLSAAYKLGNLTEALAGLDVSGNGVLLAGEDDVITIAFKMQESAGNEYQGKSIGTDFSIVLLATQYTKEDDSFDDQYDAAATKPVVSVVPADNTEVVLESESETIEVIVPAEATQAGDVYEMVVSNENVATDSVSGATTVGFDLTMYKNDVKISDGDTIYEVKMEIAKGATIAAVTHNGVAMTAADTGADQTYTYDAATGVLTIYTKSFSPFAVTYTDFKDYVVKTKWQTGNTGIFAATGSDFLPVAAVNPQIAAYSIFDGNTRLTNEVRFRFSKVEKQDIDENSYKVSFELVLLDENGKALELKPGRFNPYNQADPGEYLKMYVNLLEIPAGYAVSAVKVNGTSFNKSTGEWAATGEYLLGYDGKDVYLQSMEAGLFEIIVSKA